MKTLLLCSLPVVLIGLFFSVECSAQEKAAFYRIVSTQRTAITSFDATGRITWTNDSTNPTFRIEWASSMDAQWATSSMPQGVCTGALGLGVVPFVPTIGATGRVYCFEASCINGFRPPDMPAYYGGSYIDTSGTIWQYDITFQSPQFTDPQDGVYTKVQLDAKFAGYSSKVGKVSRSTLARMMELIPGAARGTLQGGVFKGYDMGYVRYTGYLYNSSNDSYTAVLLRTETDVISTNTAPEASAIMGWLIGI
jgi:hypothetical protein